MSKRLERDVATVDGSDAAASGPRTHPHPDRPGRRLVPRLGPGLITGAADDDPGGIATYSQAGAQFGFGLAWTIPVTLPLLAAVQEISARIGQVTGQGIMANLRARVPRPVLYLVVAILTVANTINLGADLGAMSASLKLVAGGPQHLYTALLGIGCAAAQILVPYHRYVRFLKWSTASLLAYALTLLAVHVDWAALGAALLRPPVSFSRDYLVAMVAVFGTTISPYLLFWQAAEEVEELRLKGEARHLEDSVDDEAVEFQRIRADTWAGIGFAGSIALCIEVTTAATLHANGIVDIADSAEAAEALRPIAGDLAFLAFAAGIIGTGLLAVPVLAGSTAYALGDALGLRVGLEYQPAQAPAFYTVIALSILVGIGIDFAPIDPMKALFWSAVLNGVLVVPLLVVVMWLASSREVMGRHVIGGRLKIVGWTTVAVMAAAAGLMMATLAR
jgi:NRAMP (natural resistance-associated macrophage protein)-like metal ion transporter